MKKRKRERKKEEKSGGKSKRRRVHILMYFTPRQIREAAATSGISSTLMVLEASMKNSRYPFKERSNVLRRFTRYRLILAS